MTDRTCSVEGCETGGKLTRGWCRTHYSRWYRWGDPLGSAPRRTAEARLLAKCEIQPNGCRLWMGATSSNGYGCMGDGGSRVVYVHRWAYEHYVGPIPDGMTVEHVCHTADRTCAGGVTCLHRRCTEPSHLTLLTSVENMMRGNAVAAINARKTHCIHGHEFTPENTRIKGNGSRDCRACAKDRNDAQSGGPRSVQGRLPAS